MMPRNTQFYLSPACTELSACLLLTRLFRVEGWECQDQPSLKSFHRTEPDGQMVGLKMTSRPTAILSPFLSIYVIMFLFFINFECSLVSALVV